MWRWTSVCAAVLAICTCVVGASADVVIDTVTVGNPMNTGQWSGESYGGYGPDRICGAVDYVFNIGMYEVTAGQYTEFLNAVAAEDLYGLYDTGMWSNSMGCKIARAGAPGSYTYSVAPDWANRPVNYVSWADAARFANWLHNGQPTGPQGLATTEDGSYFLNGATSSPVLPDVVREPDATWVVPSEDEWYKAAYHKNDGITGNYWNYQTGTDQIPSNQLIDPDPGNNATFRSSGTHTIGSPYWRTEIGAHENSDGPYGTFDQGGNVWEWNEAVIGSSRGLRGGSCTSDYYYLHGSYRYYHSSPSPDNYVRFGFRVAYIPAAPLPCPGDANCDGVISWRDIDYFVAAMNDNIAAWWAMFPPPGVLCRFSNNDVNGDGTVNWRDIDPLVGVMNTTCP